jgi:hypothetical protein
MLPIRRLAPKIYFQYHNTFDRVTQAISWPILGQILPTPERLFRGPAIQLHIELLSARRVKIITLCFPWRMLRHVSHHNPPHPGYVIQTTRHGKKSRDNSGRYTVG